MSYKILAKTLAEILQDSYKISKLLSPGFQPFRHLLTSVLLGGQEETVFLIAVIVFGALAAITICQEKEVPLKQSRFGRDTSAESATTYRDYLKSIVYMPKYN